jgi:hypothetical protein
MICLVSYQPIRKLLYLYVSHNTNGGQVDFYPIQVNNNNNNSYNHHGHNQNELSYPTLEKVNLNTVPKQQNKDPLADLFG